jgi:hypothetical protein
MSLLGVVDVVDRDWRDLVSIVLARHVLPHDLGQIGTDLDSRDLDAEHRAGMRPGEGRIFVGADGPRLRRPEHVKDARSIQLTSIVALDDRCRDFVEKWARA